VPTYDLHTHSTASDGAYAPAELVEQAAAAGITGLALTDHDSTAGLAEAQAAAATLGVRLIPAVEISATWQNKTIHIVGLNISPECELLRQGLARLQATRHERAQEMSRRLAKYGIPGVFEAVQTMAGDGMITRTHFAKHLAGLGLAGSVRDAFDRYLTHGKPGYVSTRWAEMEEAVTWIRTAGGAAVLAHPQRYKLTGSWLRRLLSEFREAGGAGLEVVSGTASPGDVQSSAEYARRFDLLASCGSDFHSPDNNWSKLGRLPPLPTGLVPVWSLWEVDIEGDADESKIVR
jgi:predicted metal-dependent phosphoesterase TrpH